MGSRDAVMLWVLFLIIGAGTFSIRYAFFALFGRVEISRTLVRILRFVPPAVRSGSV